MVRLVRSNEYYLHRQIQSVIPTEVILSSQDIYLGTYLSLTYLILIILQIINFKLY